MRKILLPAITVLLLTLIIAAVPTDAEGAIYDDTVRLHILANSDTKEDQALKLAVRDAVLEEYGERLTGAKNTDDATEKIGELILEIEKTATDVVQRHGFDYPVVASLTTEYYETREYEDFTLPCGEYTSLKIVIGEGGGKNWWCVMYPPLCLGASVRDDCLVSYTDEEVRLIKQGRGYKVKFKLLELLSKNFG